MKKNKIRMFWSNLLQSAKEGLKPEWKDLYWVAIAAIVAFVTMKIAVNIRMNQIEEMLALQNREMLASAPTTVPGIRDLAGNALDGDGDGTPGGDFVYQFTIAEPTGTAVPTTTPFPICTPVPCEAGYLVCQSGECLGGCGLVCALDITPVPPGEFKPPAPGLICVYFYPENSDAAPISYCYNNPQR